jgi:hypothetical protein
MTITPRIFRIAVITTFVLDLLSFVTKQYFPELIPVILQTADKEANAAFIHIIEGFVFSPAIIPICLGLGLFLIAILASMIGLILFKKWARSLVFGLQAIGLLVMPLVIYLVSPLTTHTVLSVVEQEFELLNVFLWGAILAVAYFSPIAQRFEATDS